MGDSVSKSDPYPNDTLRWVAAEVRFPPSPALTESVPADLQNHLQSGFPILEEEVQLNVSVVGGGIPQQVVRRRFLTRDRLRAVTVSREGVTLEATQYDGWTDFRGTFVRSLEALARCALPAGVLRVGLRYIDEIRIPEAPGNLAGWSGWVDDRLIAPFSLYDPNRLTNATVVLQYGQQGGFTTVFRAAPFARGRTVLPQGALRVPVDTPDDAYFLLDADASWSDADRKVPEFDPGQVSGILDQLHESCLALFEASITDRLRDDVLRRDRNGGVVAS